MLFGTKYVSLMLKVALESDRSLLLITLSILSFVGIFTIQMSLGHIFQDPESFKVTKWEDITSTPLFGAVQKHNMMKS